MDYHYHSDSKALTQVSLLFSIFSFKHFNQYLPRQLKGSNSIQEEFSFGIDLFCIFLNFLNLLPI